MPASAFQRLDAVSAMVVPPQRKQWSGQDVVAEAAQVKFPLPAAWIPSRTAQRGFIEQQLGKEIARARAEYALSLATVHLDEFAEMIKRHVNRQWTRP